MLSSPSLISPAISQVLLLPLLGTQLVGNDGSSPSRPHSVFGGEGSGEGVKAGMANLRDQNLTG